MRPSSAGSEVSRSRPTSQGSSSASPRPSLDEVLDRIGHRRGGRVGSAQAVEDLTEERQRA